MSKVSTARVEPDYDHINADGSFDIDANGSAGATNLWIEIDGVVYGSLFFGRGDDGRWRIELGQPDDVQGQWVERNPITRTGGWIELNDGGYYPVIDGKVPFRANDGYPITHDTPQEAYAVLYAVMSADERDLPGYTNGLVVDMREETEE